MTRTRCLASLALILALLVSSAAAQVITGTPPFGSLAVESGPDIVNLGNLNVHMVYPVLHKAGRGLPMSFDLTSDSSIWQPMNSGSATTWNPVSGAFGFSGSPQGVGNIGFVCVTDEISQIQCSDFTYFDSAGTSHPFNGVAAWFSCDFFFPCGDFPLLNSITTDSSGFTLNADACSVINNQCNLVMSLASADGSSIVPQDGIPLNPTITAGSVIDRNGNEITTDAAGSVLDTLGLQNGLKTLRVSGGNPNPYVLAYTSPAGTNANVSVTFKSYQVKTNFGCAGIGEYGPLTKSLVDKITLPDGTFYQFTYETTPGFTGDVTARVASVQLPTGAMISYSYTGTNNGIMCKDGSTSGFTRTEPGVDGTWTFTRTLGAGAASTTTVVDPRQNTTVVQFQGILETQRQTYYGPTNSANLLQTVNTCYNSAASSCTAAVITPPVLSRTVTTQLGTAVSSVTSKKVYTYNIYGLSTEEDDYDWGATAPGALLKKTIITYNTSLGNTRSLPATVTIQNGSSGAIVSSAAMTYDEQGPTGTIGTPQHATITGPRGNLTTLAVTANASTTLYRKFTYFDTGTPRTSTAVSTSSTLPGATTTYNYAPGTASCGNSFVTSVSEPLGLSHSVTWDCVGGVPLTATDENGAVTSSTYTDSFFWRPSKTTDAFPSDTLLTYTGANVAESALTFNGGASTVDELRTLDGLGRPTLTQTLQAPGATTFDSAQTSYGWSLTSCISPPLECFYGQPTTTVSLPYAGTAGQVPPNGTAVITTYNDPLRRPVFINRGAGGYVRNTYTKNDVFTMVPGTSGEAAKEKQFEYDGLGRLSSVCEVTGAAGSGTCGQNVTLTGYWTKYTYDGNGNLASVTQNAQAAAGSQQTRTYAYDRLGRMTSETNPENGAKTYTYDADATCGSSVAQAGQLVKGVDAANNVTCYAYDALNRKTNVTYPSGPYAASTPAKTYVYDATTFTCTNTTNAFVKGRLAEAYTGPSTAKITDIAYCYSPRGEITDVFESTPNSGGLYHTTASYWANGAVNTLGGVSGQSATTFALDGEGRPYSATYGASTHWVNSTTYYPSQPQTTVTYGSGTTDKDIYGYDANTGRMNSFQFTVGGTPKTLTGIPGWNVNGTLGTLAITDQFNASNTQTCTYVHDDLARIQSANCVNGSTAVWNQNFTLDPFGNVSKSGTSSFAASYLLPNGTTNNQEQTVSGCAPTYDANGNLTKDCTFATPAIYAWDADGNAISLNGKAVTYDAFDREVEFPFSSTHTQILYSTIGKLGFMDGQSAKTVRIPLPGGSTAELLGANGSTQHILHSDWLGSARLSTTVGGRVLAYDTAYAPYGESYAGAGTQTADLDFTGQFQDTTAGLYDFLYRQYNPVQGRWLRPDPAGLGAVDPTDPQSWNRYAYVGNSPLNRVDPLGLDDCGDWGCDGGGGDPCGDWGCDPGGGGGGVSPININWGARGVNAGPSGFTGCGVAGLPCGMNLPSDPYFDLAMAAVKAAIRGNWKSALGIGLGGLEQGLGGTGGCEFGDCEPDGNSFGPEVAVWGARGVTWGVRIGGWADALAGGVFGILLMQTSDSHPHAAQMSQTEQRFLNYIAQAYCVDRIALGDAIHEEKASRGMGPADNLSKDEIRQIARMLPKIPGCTPTEQ